MTCFVTSSSIVIVVFITVTRQQEGQDFLHQFRNIFFWLTQHILDYLGKNWSIKQEGNSGTGSGRGSSSIIHKSLQHSSAYHKIIIVIVITYCYLCYCYCFC